MELNRKGETIPAQNGGISFMVVPSTGEFWIYICPMNAGFSKRQSVKCLREKYENNVVPWGTLMLDSSIPLIQQLVETASRSDLPSEVGALLNIIIENNLKATNAAREIWKYLER